MNPAYKGVTYAFRYEVIEPKQRKSVKSHSKSTYKLRDEKEWIPVPNATPSIVDADTWDKAQEQLRRNMLYSKRNRKHQYLLTNGRLRCGVCGRAMVGSCQGRRLLYRCICNIKTNYYDHCPQPTIVATKIEPPVWDEIKGVLKNPALVIDELNRQRNDKARLSLEADQILIENRIKQVTKEEQRYLRLYGQERIDQSTLLAEIDRVRRDKEALQSKLAELKQRQNAFEQVDIRLERLPDVLAELNGKLEGADYELKQLALEALEVKVTIYPNGDMRLDGSIPTNANCLTQGQYLGSWY